MNKKTHTALAFILPVFLLVILYIFSLQLRTLSCGSYVMGCEKTNDTFKFTILSSPDSKYNGKEILIDNDAVKTDNTEYLYYTKDTSEGYSVVFIKDYSQVYAAYTGLQISDAKFTGLSTNNKGSSSGSFNVSQDQINAAENISDDKDMLHYSFNAYMRINSLISNVKIYSLPFIILMLICYTVFLKPLFALNTCKRIFNLKTYGIPNTTILQVISIFIMLMLTLIFFIL